MVNITEITDLLIKHEDLRTLPYTDTTGHLTIGVGRNLTDDGISIDEAMIMLDDDINNKISDLKKHLPYYDSLPDKVQLVLIDMCFNMGIGGLLTFKNTLLLIKTGQYKKAADAMLKSLWAKQVGNRAIEDSNILKSI
jgi:lysozyme